MENRKHIALIHTVKSVSNTFEEQLKKGVSVEIRVSNLLDDFLANDPNETGIFSIENRNRLFQDMKTQEMTGADILVVTCSTLTPIVELIRPFMKIPVVAIDDAMAKKAVTYGEHVLVMATAGSTIEPTKNKLRAEAEKADAELTPSSMEFPEAFRAMKAGNMEKHDAILLKEAEKLGHYDCIVLAQASMAHLEERIQKICKSPVLSSPSLCIAQVEDMLHNRQAN